MLASCQAPVALPILKCLLLIEPEKQRGPFQTDSIWGYHSIRVPPQYVGASGKEDTCGDGGSFGEIHGTVHACLVQSHGCGLQHVYPQNPHSDFLQC